MLGEYVKTGMTLTTYQFRKTYFRLNNFRFLSIFTLNKMVIELAVNDLYEKELLLRISKNDEKAFKEVFYLYKERFYAAAIKMTHSQDAAEEIVQEVFIMLWLHRSALAKVDSPASYLHTIVNNKISARFKRMALEKRMKEKFAEEVREGECNTQELIYGKEANRLLHLILHQLPPQQQLVYHLSEEEGLSRQEIAEQLQISPHTVKNHLLKATKYIRSHWNNAIILALFLLF